MGLGSTPLDVPAGLTPPRRSKVEALLPVRLGVAVTGTRFHLSAKISTENPTAVRAVLDRKFGSPWVNAGPEAGEFRLETEMEGASARELNRDLLSELRRAEKRTRLRAEWTSRGTTERFFDYVPKGTKRA